MIQEKQQLKAQLAKEKESGSTFKERESKMQKYIDDLIFEKKGAVRRADDFEREMKSWKEKYDNNYSRFTDAINRNGQLEKDIKEQEQVLMKRHNELNSTIKENNYLKDELYGITKRFGSADQIKEKMDLAELKEQKVNDLIAELEHTQVSSEFANDCQLVEIN